LTNTYFALRVFNQDREKYLRNLQKFIINNKANNEKCLDIVEKKETISNKK
jgi:hypothetical protein